ncbi:unnamed protein product [Allacma fusca]|uniref:Uncharacterized protein n=1 Tax=Allacma fusca TaxID=39272 RepID=A0A8J2K9H5_9HEXA|nr:unnamed protein product [Allacma fusca]
MFFALVIILACIFTAECGYFGCNDPEGADVNIYLRSHENKTCGIFHVLFPKTYKLNETTTCRCTKKYKVTCRTIEIVNATITTAATSDHKNADLIPDQDMKQGFLPSYLELNINAFEEPVKKEEVEENDDIRKDTNE